MAPEVLQHIVYVPKGISTNLVEVSFDFIRELENTDEPESTSLSGYVETSSGTGYMFEGDEEDPVRDWTLVSVWIVPPLDGESFEGRDIMVEEPLGKFTDTEKLVEEAWDLHKAGHSRKRKGDEWLS